MIGVIANPSDHDVVREFFELFKTPWELFRNGQSYDVVICDDESKVSEQSAPLLVVYSVRQPQSTSHDNVEKNRQARSGGVVVYEGKRIPIYQGYSTFLTSRYAFLISEENGHTVGYLEQFGLSTIARIGYDLFREVRTLLTKGQPVCHAGIPTLDLHIMLLRDILVSNGVPLVEIPPVPAGYRFIACLTHDVDHPSIRRHSFDHTMFGFVYRAIFRTLVDVLRGRMRFSQLLDNWWAVVRLPLVYLGLVKDFWQELDRYPALEPDHHSSFFVIPFAGRPGQLDGGLAPKHRASRYGAAEIAGQIQSLLSQNCEVGLHGIDAWIDPTKGRAELEQIRRITKTQQVGVRMHWLYFNEQSPVTLENAGADYDSTVGYNETVGYRAGTTQAYKPLEATRLLELPLHVMDTALFFPTHLDLSSDEAKRRVDRIIDHATVAGGTVTLNWHDRSIAPERLWGEFYVDLIHELRSKGAWFATAREAVAWFRKRRSATFEIVRSGPRLRADAVAVDDEDRLPLLQLRVSNLNASKSTRDGECIDTFS